MRLYAKTKDSTWELVKHCAFNSECGECRHPIHKGDHTECHYNVTLKLPLKCERGNEGHIEITRGI